MYHLSPGCVDSNVPLSGSKGRLASPAQGETGVCAWEISVPKNLRIIFYFDSYNIASSYTSYPDDRCPDKDTRIELKDGPTDPPWKSYCQSRMPEPIATNKSSLFVKFKLSKGDSESWFTAVYFTLPFEHSKYDCVFNKRSPVIQSSCISNYADLYAMHNLASGFENETRSLRSLVSK